MARQLHSIPDSLDGFASSTAGPSQPRPSNRFTITDYEYDHGDVDLGDWPAQPGFQAQDPTSTSDTRQQHGNAAGLPVRGIGSTEKMPRRKVSDGSAKLRLHQSHVCPLNQTTSSDMSQTIDSDLNLAPPLHLSTELTPQPSLSSSSSWDHGRLDEEDKAGWSDDDSPESSRRKDEKTVHIVETGRSEIQHHRTGASSWLTRIIPSSKYCRMLLVTVFLETIIDLAIEANILYRFNVEVKSSDSTELQLENKRRLPVYLCIFGLAHLFQLTLSIDAIRTRNTIQVVGLAIFNAMFLIYAGIQISEVRNILDENVQASDDATTLLSLPLNVLTAVIIGVIGLSEVVVSVLTVFIWREFGWKIYRFLGADIRIKKYYFQYQIFECICRFSAFFFAGFGIQFIFLVLQKTDVEYIITWIALPLSLLLLVTGTYAAKYENKWFMTVFMAGLVAGSAYFTFKLFRIYEQKTTTYLLVAKSLTVFSALSLVCLIMCGVLGAMVWRNFKRGLKDHVIQPRSGSSAPPGSSMYPMQGGMTLAQKRISIE
ncbi:hypothetical protein P7C73_g4616, partial [Tremellales sp. Uapishka_1]